MSESPKKTLWDLLGEKQKYSPALLIAALCLGILLFGISHFAQEPQQNNVGISLEMNFPETEISRAEKMLEQRLEHILSQVAGAGKVDVSVFLATGTRYEYAINVSANKRIIDEKDQGGGVRLTTEDNLTDQYVLIRGNQTEEKPVIIQENSPEIQGVLVVADGAKNARIKAQLLQAVQVALGLEPHRIQILAREAR